ncbi:ABC transporter permease [Amycolatopsis anabasis]|uniref:ABC transporter permease n=1 Tax=Amycolatopsis anabasis TaxID=1840409 RepID=UPI00131C8975|nr:ABC transporter permease [Amycolatopsis anabasis]
MISAEIRAELLVLRKRPAVWVLLAAELALSLTFAYLLPITGYLSGRGSPGNGFATPEAYLAAALPDQLVPNTLGGMPLFGGALALIFGVLVAGSDYAWDTVKTRATQLRSRAQIGTAKLAGVAIGTLIAVVAAFAAGAVCSGLVAVTTGHPARWPDVAALLTGIGGGWLVLTMWAFCGAALGYLFRTVALPIGLGLVWIMGVENLITNVLGGQVSWLEPVRKVLPAADAGSVVGAIVRGTDLGAPPPGINFLSGGTQAVVILVAYLLAFAAVSLVTLRRRDISS